ncbi:CdaR family transcriptional regulator [Thermoanaerobacterium thermosaccharolyticum]|uniref:Polyketide synthase regulator n=1 Tax=Thermoanaerobacterium thermosaccharolyticum TaxID=1517 RepID=A0A223I0C9_THETR|nr:helix-turn-helix domain-containing protein [Thermoanaerobacterium thermosaccharolyticum]AST58178.1 polyketide synthase regulator [Thermoanaerobacterium thermosaccharolyticum]PHO07187.1 CdaR family transcriptional regulator [Thermoanaerobacterium thermosaccharolyticum]
MNIYDDIRKAVKDFQKYVTEPVFLIDKDGKLIYSGDESLLKKEGIFAVNREFMDRRDVYEWQGMTFYNIFVNGWRFLTVGIRGTGDKAKNMVMLLSTSFEHLSNQVSKEDFLLKLLIGDLDRDEIEYYIEKYKFEEKDLYRVIIIESHDAIDDAFKIVGHIFEKNSYQTVIICSNKFAVLLLESVSADIDKATKTLKDTIESEVYIKIDIGVSNKAYNFTDISKGYREASIALKLGKKIDNNERGIYFYRSYALEELLLELPEDVIKRFLEALTDGELDYFNDDELVSTLNSFFRNSLNLSETSRDLYIHRNTLVYRLDKLHKLTGFDPKQFNDAVMLKVIMTFVKLLT